MKHTTNNSIKNMAMIITVPHRTNAGGTSPNRLRTFSERNSIPVSFFIVIYFKIALSLFLCS